MSRSFSKQGLGNLRNILTGRRDLRQAIFNINWLFLGRAVFILLGLFVGVWVARYLGPKRYGILNYCVAFVALSSFLSTLGLNAIVVRNLVQKPDSSGEIMGSAALLKFLGATLHVGVATALIAMIRPGDRTYLIFVLIIACGYLFRTLDVVDYWFQSKVQSKYTVLSNITATILVSVAKIAMILLAAPLIAFVWTVPATGLILTLGLYFCYRVRSKSILKWKVRASAVKDLLSDSWPLMLSGIAVVVYMKIDQVMLGQMVGDTELGKYSAAVRLSEAWFFMPVAISGSIFPALLKARDKSRELYIERLQNVFDLFFWFSVVVAGIVMLTSGFIVETLFGSVFADAAGVLSVHIWSGVFVFFGTASSHYLIAENITRISLYRTLAGAIVNVGLNLLLIPRMGIMGAAWATLVSYAVSGFIAHVLFKDSRIVFVMMLKSVNPLSLARYVGRYFQ